MRVEIQTTRPKSLLQKVYEAINDGSIRTWAVDKDGDLTHLAARWANRAWLRPKVSDGNLVFELVSNTKPPTTLEEAAYYVGHFTETMVTHFSAEFVRICTIV